MLYILILALCMIFFVWATILETVAHFLIQNKVNFQGFLFQKNSQYILIAGCVLSLFIACFTYASTYPAYFIFISALWITVFTDLNYMLISRLVSLYLIPIGIILSFAGFLPISPIESVLSSILAGSFLLITNATFKILKGHDGLGQGDIELIAFIGAWIGFLGTWCTIVIGSVTGSIIGITYLLWTRQQVRILPFGPFLALGAIIFLMYSDTCKIIFGIN